MWIRLACDEFAMSVPHEKPFFFIWLENQAAAGLSSFRNRIDPVSRNHLNCRSFSRLQPATMGAPAAHGRQPVAPDCVEVK
jgi:hypothetical protein